MKKLFHLTTSLGVGGAEYFLYNLCNSDLKKKYECTVITLKSGGLYEQRIKNAGVKVLSLNMKRGSLSITSLIKYYSICKKLKPDIIQGWMYHGNFFAFIYKLFFLKKIPILWNIRATLYDVNKERLNTRIIIYILKYFSSFVDLIIYNSEVSRQQHSKLGFSKKNSKIIYNGVDVNFWKPNFYIKKKVRNQFDIKSSTVIIGFAARNHPMKDIPNFLSAMEIVFKKNTNIFLIMAGEGVDNEFIKHHNLNYRFPQNRFIILGLIENLEQLMPSFDITCLSSAWGEGFPNVIGQAMSCESIAVSTNIGDVKEIIKNNNRICESKSPTKLAQIILSLISLSKEERSKIGKENRKIIENNFNFINILDKYLAVYTKVL